MLVGAAYPSNSNPVHIHLVRTAVVPSFFLGPLNILWTTLGTQHQHALALAVLAHCARPLRLARNDHNRALCLEQRPPATSSAAMHLKSHQWSSMFLDCSNLGRRPQGRFQLAVTQHPVDTDLFAALLLILFALDRVQAVLALLVLADPITSPNEWWIVRVSTCGLNSTFESLISAWVRNS